MNKVEILIISTAIISFFLFSCDSGIDKINEVEQRDKADSIVNIFYEKNAMSRHIFSKGFIESVNLEKFDSAVTSYHDKLGTYQDREIYKWTSERSIGLNPKWKVILIYLVEYEKSKAIEQFDLIKENDSMKIENYIIDSKALINTPSHNQTEPNTNTKDEEE